MKKVLMVLMAITFSIASFGQTATKNYSAFENTYVGIQTGVFTPLDFNSVTPLNNTVGIKVGKWITPVVGFNIEGNVWFGSNHFSDTNKAVRATNVGINVMSSSWINGINPTFSIIPEVGIGWLHQYTNSDDMSAKTGIICNFRASDAISIYANPTIFWNLGDYNKFNKNHAQLGIQFGVNYHFKNKDNTRKFTQYNIGYFNEKINALRKPIVKEVVKEVIKEVNICDTIKFNNAVVFFSKASDTITDYSDLNKIESGSIVEVHGYASPEGSNEFNIKLSQRRADNVAEYLRKRGIHISKSMGHGSTDDTSNRVVLVY